MFGFDFHDTVSSASHLLTAFWAAFATLILLRLTRGHGAGRLALGFFGLSMVLLYTASGVFHGLHYHDRAERLLFQKIDKSAVFLLIAGSFVPVFVYLLDGLWRRLFLTALLGATAAGVAVLWLTPDLPHETLVGVYVGTGLIGLVPIPRYAAVLGWGRWPWLAGIVGPYLGGAVVEVLQRPVLIPGWLGAHELMHFADTLGTLAYFAFAVRFLAARAPKAAPRPAPEPAPAWPPPPSRTRSGFVPVGV